MDEALLGIMPVGRKAPSTPSVSKHLQRVRDRIIGAYVIRGAKARRVPGVVLNRRREALGMIVRAAGR